MAFSRAAVKVVRAGFVISSLYNVIGISIAAAGMLSPIVCAILMPLSSATVATFSCGTTAWLGARLLHSTKADEDFSAKVEIIRPVMTTLEEA
jgi:Cu+-exporting ATPase